MQTGRIQTTRHITVRSEWRRRGGGGASDVGSSASDDSSDAPTVRAMPPHQSFVVAHSPFVFVREERSAASKQLGYKWRGEVVACEAEVDGWLKLAGEDGWMLRDGASLQPPLGALLLPAAAAGHVLAEHAAHGASEQVYRNLVELRFPKSTPRADARIATDADGVRRSVAEGLRKTDRALDQVGLPRRLRRAAGTRADAPLVDLNDDVGGVGGGPPPTAPPPAPAAVAEAGRLSASALIKFVKRNEPVVLRGGAHGWAPVAKWTPAHLARVAGHRTIPVRAKPAAGASGRLFGDVQRMGAYETTDVRLAELLAELEGADDAPPAYYGAKLRLRDQLPELFADADDGPAEEYASCFGAAEGANPIAYIGAGAQATPMHFDAAENLLCVVAGAKELLLYPPAEGARLAPVGERNTSTIYSRIDFTTALDFGRFPALRGAAPRAVTVRAGDVLYLPCGWWHAVRGSVDFNLSVNYWFALHDEKKDQALVVGWLTGGGAEEEAPQGVTSP